MFDYFRKYSSNIHHVCCEDSPTKGVYDHCQSDDLDFQSRSQVQLRCHYFLTCNFLDNFSAITFKLGITVDLWMPYMLMLVSMTLTLLQGHSGSAKAKNQRCILLATEQAITIKLATTVSLIFLFFLRDLDFANVSMA